MYKWWRSWKIFKENETILNGKLNFKRRLTRNVQIERAYLREIKQNIDFQWEELEWMFWRIDFLLLENAYHCTKSSVFKVNTQEFKQLALFWFDLKELNFDENFETNVNMNKIYFRKFIISDVLDQIESWIKFYENTDRKAEE